MQNQTNLPPGTQVRNARGIIGAVERVAPGTGGPMTSNGTVVVRSVDQRLLYAFPADIVSDAGKVHGKRVAQIAVDDQALPRYLLADHTGPGQEAAGLVGDRRNQSSGGIPANPVGDTLTIPLAQEQIVAETQPVVRGTVHLRKTVETTPQHIAVAVSHEQATIQRIPAAQFDPKMHSDPDLIVIPIVEERLVVQVQPVVTEYICIRKDRVTEMQEVSDMVRREVLTVTQDADAGTPALFDVQGRNEHAPQG